MYSDCFAQIELHCGVLKEMLCKYGTCPFYKSKEQYEEEKIIYPHLNGYVRKKRKFRES